MNNDYRIKSSGAAEIRVDKVVLENMNGTGSATLVDFKSAIDAAAAGLLDVEVSIDSVGYDGEVELTVIGWRPATAAEQKEIEAEMLAAQQHSQQLSEQSNRRREQLNARGIRVARYEE